MVIRLERVPTPTVATGSTVVPEAAVARRTDLDDLTTERPGGRRRRRIALVVALVALLVASGASLTAWALIAPPGAVGHDVSYPQCGTALPTGGTFGVVGVNGGKVSTANPCLSSQYAWAAKTTNGASLYANTGNPGSISTFYWPASGSRDPALCTDRTSASDPGCAYDYGWHGGKNSLQLAQNSISGAAGRTWWLDVELANSWNGSSTANAAALQGAVDGLHDAGVGTVGVYSTAYQWSQITGGYSSGNAATYRSAWSASFAPKHPLEQAPLWIAGLSTLDAASHNCSTSFTGGTTALAQYTDGATDGDLVCGGAPTPPTTTPTTPTSPSGTTTAPTTTSTLPTTSAMPTTSPATSGSPTTSPSGTPSTSPTPTTTSAPTTTTPTTTTPTTTTPTTTTVATPPLGAPGTPTAVAGNASVALSWTAPAGSPRGTTYTVTRSDPTAPTPRVVAQGLTSTTWTDRTVTNNRAYTYRVAAVAAGATGPASAPVTVTPSAAPGAPTRLTATTDRTAGVDLAWTAPASTGGSPVNRYVILRGTAPTREAALGILNCRTATCAWRDTSTARGATYYYQVVALDDANATGPRTPEVAARAR